MVEYWGCRESGKKYSNSSELKGSKKAWKNFQEIFKNLLTNEKSCGIINELPQKSGNDHKKEVEKNLKKF